jgi:GT2 family glycosyltransferase
LADRPQLTVAIPTCNGARHLAEALRGILAQVNVAFDLLISDDRSDDETLGVVGDEAGDHSRVVINSERLGLAGNWNQCVALSGTPFVAIFHQDDVMRPGHLAAHLAAFQVDERIGLVDSASEVIDAEGQSVPEAVVERGGLGPIDRTFGPGQALPELARGNPIRCSAVTLRAAAHADVGGFDPSYRYVVDWDFWLRVARRWGVAWLARPSVAVRWHPASETHRFQAGTLDLEETARLLEGLFSEEGRAWTDARRLRGQAHRRLSRAYWNRAYDAHRAGDPVLAWNCLRRAVALWPGIVGRIFRDPRIAARMATLPFSRLTSASPLL